MIKRVAILALILSTSAVGLLAFSQWRSVGPTPSAQAVMKEFSAAFPVGSSEDEIVASLDRRGLEHWTQVTDSGDILVLDYGVPAGARVIEARIEQHDDHPISFSAWELRVSFVINGDHELDRMVVVEMDFGL